MLAESLPGRPEFTVLADAVIARLDAEDDQSVLAALAERLTAAGHVTETFAAAVRDRERQYPTGLPTSVPCAIPHTDLRHVRRSGVAVATLARAVSFGMMGTSGEERLDVELVIMLVLGDGHTQVGALQHLVARLHDPDAARPLLGAPDDGGLRIAAEAWLAG
ncbi:PTS sugar transporter subunit IIA [Brachybacterium nesterenkovii]|uniref:PTS sugar transporter subunit IIA n=1 Tax=Brachybacterium nesterenkovii TaxID=47847 RepID=UPI00321B35DD